MKKHIFLTGEKQVGKSTVINKVLQSVPSYYGLKSVSSFNENGDRMVFLQGANNNNNLGSQLAGICSKGHVIEKNPKVFDSFGVSLLRSGTGNILVVDEIGNMERSAAVYEEEIEKLISQDKVLILGVLQKRADTTLAQFIRNSSNVELIEVSEENRESLPSIILDKINKY